MTDNTIIYVNYKEEDVRMITNNVMPVLNELGETNSVKVKEAILLKYKNDALLKRVIYLACSPRVKFYIKKIPPYSTNFSESQTLEEGLNLIEYLSCRTVTGNTAVSWLATTLTNATISNAIVLERIIKKDLRCGINSSTINKVWPGLIETTPYMGAIAYNKKKAEKLFKTDNRGVVSQTKMDGRYVNVIVNENGEAQFESRSGEITYLGDAFDDVFPKTPNGFVLCGELTMHGFSRYESNGIIASIVSINKKIEQGKNVWEEKREFKDEYTVPVEQAEQMIQLTVWDILTLHEYAEGESMQPYSKRLKELYEMESLINNDRVDVVYTVTVRSIEEARNVWEKTVARGDEGTIIKGLSCTWKHGKPNEQIKIKLQFDVDLRIIGFNQGTPGTRLANTLGSLICESEDGLLQTDPGGIKDEMRKYIWENRNELIGKYVEVTCSGLSVTKDGFSLLHPRFSKLRLDKSVGDTLATIEAIEESLKELS